KEPHYILDLINAGIEIPKVNVGALFEEGDRKPYTKRVALDEKELADLKAIADKGIPVFFEYTPDDENEVSLAEVLKNKGEN
ncbi:PTS sugar transporter subunit IIB, partial [Lactobacillus gasseri]|nr:PTS sugar transporter subunit IIB [Lactobacillus gasseri]